MDKIIYLKADKCILVEKKQVRIKDVAEIFADEKEKIENLCIYEFEDEQPNRYVMSVMDVITVIKQKMPEAVVINLGESDFIVEYNLHKKEKVWLETIKVVLIGLVVFFGSAFAIMSFHEDVGIRGLFEDVYSLVIGKEKNGTSVIELSYSVGLFLGILIFYNRMGRGGRMNDPTPLEIEMKTYEETVNDTLILTDERSSTND